MKGMSQKIKRLCLDCEHRFYRHAVSLICGTQGGPGGGSDSMDHETRERVMNEFRNGETKVLIATDVLARGIDVPQVNNLLSLFTLVK